MIIIDYNQLIVQKFGRLIELKFSNDSQHYVLVQLCFTEVYKETYLTREHVRGRPV